MILRINMFDPKSAKMIMQAAIEAYDEERCREGIAVWVADNSARDTRDGLCATDGHKGNCAMQESTKGDERCQRDVMW